VAEMQGAWATQPIAVGDDALKDVALSLHEGVHMRGRIDYVGTSPEVVAQSRQPLPFFVTRVPTLTRDSSGLSRALSDAEGRFDLIVPPGRYVIGLTKNLSAAVIAPWSLESVTVAGREVPGGVLEVEKDLAEMVVRYTKTPAQISGTVLGTNAQRADDAAVFLFPRDNSLWSLGRVSSQAFRSVRVSAAGAFLVESVMPGEYFLAAASESVSAHWPDRTYLQKLLAIATPVQVSAGQAQTISLRLAAGR
jgi:hypothetical protein